MRFLVTYTSTAAVEVSDPDLIGFARTLEHAVTGSTRQDALLELVRSNPTLRTRLVASYARERLSLGTRLTQAELPRQDR